MATAARLGISRCNHPLADDRTCIHVKDAPGIRYERCPSRESYGILSDDKCWHPFAKDKPHRHSHTWQLGDARLAVIGGKYINLETGEFAGNAEFGTAGIIEGIKSGPYHCKPELDPDRQANGLALEADVIS